MDTQGPGSAAAAGGATACALNYVKIPNASNDGVTGLSPGLAPQAFQNTWCGSVLGIDGTVVAMSVVCKSLNTTYISHKRQICLKTLLCSEIVTRNQNAVHET